MNSENAFKKLGQKLMNGEITPEEHVKEYNKLLREMAEKYVDRGGFYRKYLIEKFEYEKNFIGKTFRKMQRTNLSKTV